MTESHAGEAQETGDDYRLLVIDDDIIQRTILSRIGAQVGFTVARAGSFDEAVGLLNSYRFDCVTLDLALAERSGAPLLGVIAESRHRTPVLIISGADGYVLESAAAMARGMGLDSAPIHKPLNLNTVREELARRRQNAPVLRGVLNTESATGASRQVA